MSKIRLAVDAMGGDHAPDAVLAGAKAFLERHDDTYLVLLGREERLRPQLAAWPAGLRQRVALRHTSEVIETTDSPAQAVRRKPDSSIAVGLALVKEKEAAAFVSAGSTGALMAGTFLSWGRIPGVRRPAIGSRMPAFQGRGFYMLDLGAHMGASAEDLVQYAIMGSVYAEEVLAWPKPRVGLLNVGTEEGKGTETIKEAFKLLAQVPGINFVGNVEGRDLFGHDITDILVCDGFVGNALLKTLEGFSEGLFGLMKQEFSQSLRAKAGAALLLPGLKRIARRLDYRETGGAPFLGVNGICVKCHGSSNANAIAQGLSVAREAVKHDVVNRIMNSIGEAGLPDA